MKKVLVFIILMKSMIISAQKIANYSDFTTNKLLYLPSLTGETDKFRINTGYGEFLTGNWNVSKYFLTCDYKIPVINTGIGIALNRKSMGDNFKENQYNILFARNFPINEKWSVTPGINFGYSIITTLNWNLPNDFYSNEESVHYMGSLLFQYNQLRFGTIFYNERIHFSYEDPNWTALYSLFSSYKFLYNKAKPDNYLDLFAMYQFEDFGSGYLVHILHSGLTFKWSYLLAGFGYDSQIRHRSEADCWSLLAGFKNDFVEILYNFNKQSDTYIIGYKGEHSLTLNILIPVKKIDLTTK
jgi:hypothetical protein